MFYGWYLENLFETNIIVPPPLAIDSGWAIVAIAGLGLIQMDLLTMPKILTFNGWEK